MIKRQYYTLSPNGSSSIISSINQTRALIQTPFTKNILDQSQYSNHEVLKF